MLPIFDSLAHPTLSGGWLGRPTESNFRALTEDLQAAEFIGACAIGLDGIEGYEHEAFIRKCQQFNGLIPIAGFHPERDASPKAMRTLRALGYQGVKIHPRFSGITQHLDSLAPALQAAGEADLTVFFCTYLHCDVTRYPTQDPFFTLVRLLAHAPDTRLVLVHGGDVEVMRYAELVRFNTNLLLDLSMTIMKYPGSSIDLDLAFLFRHFDRRICIGSDWPEYRPEQLRQRFELLACDLPEEKRRNIAYQNLISFLKINKEFGHANTNIPT